MRASVAMATYNGARYIVEQLDSLRLQTRQADEVVIFDDCSSDDTFSIVAEFIAENRLDNWRLLMGEENLGYKAAFKRALLECAGDVVFFCDQDDVWHPEKIARCVQVIEHEPQVQVLACEYGPLVSSADAPRLSAEAAHAMTGDGSLQRMLIGESAPEIWIGCALAIRRGFIDDALPFWFDGWAHDSWAWVLSCAIGGCFMLHESLFKRRLHEGNVSMHSHHELKDRVSLLEDKVAGDQAAIAYAKHCAQSGRHGCDDAHDMQLAKQERFDSLRLALVRERRLGNVLKLVPLLGSYPYKRSFLVETALALKGGAR